MDWKLLLIGAVMMLGGGFLAWRFRASNYRTQTGPGCAMAFALLMLLTGVLTFALGFLYHA